MIRTSLARRLAGLAALGLSLAWASGSVRASGLTGQVREAEERRARSQAQEADADSASPIGTAGAGSVSPPGNGGAGPAAPTETAGAPRASGLGPGLDVGALEAGGTLIGSIRIVTHEIFDPRIPAESRALYRLANSFHIGTRERTIRRQLLFAEGEPLNRGRLEETERNLRALPFLREASVSVEGLDAQGRAMVIVSTQDTWTTRVSARLGSAGGKTTRGFSVAETNVLGLGKKLELQYLHGIDRITRSFIYEDPNVLASRHRMRAVHEESSDGESDVFHVESPFYSLETRLAYSLSAFRILDEFTVYSGGESVQTFDREQSEIEAWAGWSGSSEWDTVRRWYIGYTRGKSLYEASGRSATPLASDKKPISRTGSGPFVRFVWIKRDFIKVRYFERLSRTEDYNLGGALSLRLHLSRRGLGATDDEIGYDFTGSKGFRTGPDSTLLGNAWLRGRVGGKEQGEGHVDLTHYYLGALPHTIVVRVSADRSVRQDGSKRYQLGGENGLRGFEVRRFDGQNRFLLTLENRYHWDREILRLLRLGVAGFVDVGNAWGGTRTVEETVCRRDPGTGRRRCEVVEMEVDNRFGNLKADVGVSVLGDVSRAAGAGFVRLNIAYPINGSKYGRGTVLLSFGHKGNF